MGYQKVLEGLELDHRQRHDRDWLGETWREEEKRNVGEKKSDETTATDSHTRPHAGSSLTDTSIFG